MEHSEHLEIEVHDEPVDDKNLSYHLSRVLDAVGVSEEVREGYYENAGVWEILDNMSFRTNPGEYLSIYGLGSVHDGTTTPGLKSDLDLLYCAESPQLVENTDDAPQHDEALLMIHDNTNPGTMKLQLVTNRKAIFDRELNLYESKDDLGYIILKHGYIPSSNLMPSQSLPEYSKARNSHSDGELLLDIGVAFRCQTIPSFANEWLHRPRSHQWPSHDQLQRMKSYGCFVVGAGDQPTEWRLCFSLQERELMCALNPTQHKCCVLLKMINKDIIQPRVGRSISSYHCKTCIFHLVESNGVDQWEPTNLVSCLLACLRLLLDWVRRGNCPNYFMSKVNLFNKLDRSTLTKLSRVLQDLLLNGGPFLHHIACDDIGMLLTFSKFEKGWAKTTLEVKRFYGHNILFLSMMDHLLLLRNAVYRSMCDFTFPSNPLSHAKQVLQYLEHTTVITELNPKYVRKALDRLIPYINLAIVQTKLSNKIPEMEERMNDDEIEAMIEEVRLHENCSILSSRITIASLYLQLGKFDECQEALEHCENLLKLNVLSFCGCSFRNFKYMPLREDFAGKSLSFEEFYREHTATCMIFLPSQANLIPMALRYEMYRSVGISSGAEAHESSRDWIAVDFKTYLYFLQYVLYTNKNKPAYKQDALDKLQHLIITDPNLGHRETGLNLLGWIYAQENRIQDALACCHRSLTIRPLHNAAAWHLAMLVHSRIDTATIYDRKWFK